MNTKFYKTYNRRLWRGLLLAAVLLLLAILFSYAFAGDGRGETKDLPEDARRLGCTCPMDRQLPIVVIDTHGVDVGATTTTGQDSAAGQVVAQKEKSPQHEAAFLLYEPGEYSYTCVCGAAEPTVRGDVLINVRGHSSKTYPKKQYNLRFVQDGLETPVELLGMPAHDKWVLNGSYGDPSLIRNALAYQMAGQIMEYAPRYEYCEVLLNQDGGKTDFDSYYSGVYLLTEKIERDPGRVDISKADPRYPDGSFIIARDKADSVDTVLSTDWGALEDDYILGVNGILRSRTMLVVNYPGSLVRTEEYVSGIESFINDFEYALRSENFESQQIGYRAYIDVDSFVGMAMINEVFKNIDGCEVSTYFYKDVGERMKAGPVWDFDLSSGNTSSREVNEPTGFRMVDAIWFNRLFQDPYFAKKYMSKYRILRKSLWEETAIEGLIDQTTAQIGEAAIERNAARWYSAGLYRFFDYDREIQKIKSFLTRRMAWMDENLQLVQRINQDTVD